MRGWVCAGLLFLFSVWLGFVIDTLAEERDKIQVELAKVRAEVQEVLKENEELAHNNGELAEAVYQCANDLYESDQRWDEHELHSAVAEFMCKCLAPPPYSIDQEMECIEITLAAEKRFEEMERSYEEADAEIW